MPSRKAKNRKVAATINADHNHRPTAGFFPFAGYVSVVGVHTTLLAFVVLFLGRVPKALPGSSSSSPFLDGLTRDPVLTVAWICAGAIPLQGWWAGWMRKWWIQFSIKGTDAEKRLEQNERDKNKFSVSHNSHFDTTNYLRLTRCFILDTEECLVGHCCNIIRGLCCCGAFWCTVTQACCFSICPFAPLIIAHSHHLHTYLLACLVSLLTVFTPAYALGIPSFTSDSKSLLTRLTWTRLFAELS